MQFIDLKKQYETLKETIDAAISKVLNGGDYIMGNDVAAIENELAKYCGVKHCITCANGTDALTISLKAARIKACDYIFVPNFTFFASAEVISEMGAKPIFVDIDEDTFNISPKSLIDQIEKLNSKGKQAKAVMTVDLFGQSCDYENIIKIAKKNNLLVIEDSAQGFGGSIKGRKNCSFGDISTTSFFPAKPLGCYGDGGAIFTDSDDYAELIKSLRVHGKGSDKYDNIRIGYNSRLDTIQASILMPKLKAFQEYELSERNKFADIYTKQLRAFVKTPIVPYGFESSWAQYTITLKSEAERQEVQTALKDKGIPSMIYYPRTMVQQTVYADYKYEGKDLEVSNGITNKVLSLPMHPYLKEEDIKTICEIIINTLASRP